MTILKSKLFDNYRADIHTIPDSELTTLGISLSNSQYFITVGMYELTLEEAESRLEAYEQETIQAKFKLFLSGVLDDQ